MKQHNRIKRLEARQKGYEDMLKNSSHQGEYTKPGSMKRS
jgi:hypothetical protein